LGATGTLAHPNQQTQLASASALAMPARWGNAMGLWKRGRRYWTQTVVNGVWIRRPLCPEGSTRATTSWQEAVRLEKELIRTAIQSGIPAHSHSIKLFAAVEDYLKAKKATANTQRTIEFDRERLDVVKRVLGDIRLSAISARTIEGFQAKRRVEGASNRTVNMDVGVLRKVLKRFKQWRRLEDDVKMLTEAGGEPVGRVLTLEEQQRLFETAEKNKEWEHVYCAAILAANTSMRGVEVKHVRRKDVDLEKRIVRIRTSKNETSKRIIPLNDSALEAVQRMITRADALGFTEADHYLWCASQHHKLDPTKPARQWDGAWRALREAAALPGLRFHDLRHTVVTRLLEAGEPDHVVESITGHLSRRMLEHYSHIRLNAKKQALDRLDQSGKAVAIKSAK
jgi:integrase